MEIIEKYFDLDPIQKSKFAELKDLYKTWNDQINVISRKDFDNFYERHVLHSLGISCVLEFKEGSRILDVGTGGGFPGIPLAILQPECSFVLIDSIGKKIKVVKEVIEALDLQNAKAYHKHSDQEKGKYDFVVSRAVTRMNKFVPWVQKNISPTQINALPNGILYLKGGDLREELGEIAQFDYDEYPLTEHFEEPFFETKKVVYVKMV